jgi:ketosteroid isomerase-like protein
VNYLTRCILLLCLLWVVAIAAATGQETTTPRVRKTPSGQITPQADGIKAVNALEKEWVEIARNHKVSSLGHILADGFLFTDTEGKLADKQAMYALLKEAGGPASTLRVLDYKVHVFSSAVIVVTSVDDIRRKGADGREVHHQERDTDTWVLIAGRWLCVAEQSTFVAKPIS